MLEHLQATHSWVYFNASGILMQSRMNYIPCKVYFRADADTHNGWPFTTGKLFAGFPQVFTVYITVLQMFHGEWDIEQSVTIVNRMNFPVPYRSVRAVVLPCHISCWYRKTIGAIYIREIHSLITMSLYCSNVQTSESTGVEVNNILDCTVGANDSRGSADVSVCTTSH